MEISRQTRVQYDQIAHLYDAQPYRQKEVDPHVLAFLHEHPAVDRSCLALLDLGCGTGNQLVANRSALSHARLVGLDLSYGMLMQARHKDQDILWVQADSSHPPFPEACFDIITSQYAFHHVRDKRAMLTAVWRLLRAGGRFVLTNIAPHEMVGWIYYRYFPVARTVDFRDFLAPDAIISLLQQIGFLQIRCARQQTNTRQDLQEFWEAVQRRDICSQLLTIPEQAYRAGLHQIEADLRWGCREVPTEVCILTICAEKPSCCGP
jgi:ubiquinone/menaquinone biosynthesis C-methylase UbiE